MRFRFLVVFLAIVFVVVPAGAIEMIYVNNGNYAGNSVSAYSIGTNGNLTLVGTYPTGGRGSFAITFGGNVYQLATTANFLYVANEYDASITPFTINPANGSLTAQAPVPTGDPVSTEMSLAVTPDGRLLLVSTKRYISMFSISSTGGLTLVSNTAHQEGFPYPYLVYGIVISPDGRFLYSSAPYGYHVSGYRITDTGLSAVPGSPFMVNFGPNALAINQSGTTLFVGKVSPDAYDGAVETYDIAPTGALTLKNSVRTGTLNACMLLLSRDETNLFVSGYRSGPALASLSVGSDGGLTPVAGSPFYGGRPSTPEGLALNDAGTQLYSANFDAINVFDVLPGGVVQWRNWIAPAPNAVPTCLIHWAATNQPPSLAPIAGGTTRWGDAVTFTATATDPDGPAAGLTYTLSGAPAGAAIDPSTGAFSWIPGGNQVGAHTFSVVVTDSGQPPLSDSKDVTFTVVKRPSTLVYTGSAAGQYSDPTTLSALLTDSGFGTPLEGMPIAFTVGTQSGSGTTSGGAASVTIALTQPAGIVNAIAAFAETPQYFGSSIAHPFTIGREDAALTFAENPGAVKVTAPGGSAPPVTLCAKIEEAADGSTGDLSLASIHFSLDPLAGNGIINAPAVITGTGGVSMACATLTGLTVDAYDISVVMTGDYYAAGPVHAVLAVYDPSLGFTTGGGTVVRDGVRANFAFHVNFLKNGQAKGGVLYIEHRPSGDFRIKSNAMGTLSISSSTAVIVAKATVDEVGNHTMVVTAVDNGEPGANNDLFGLLVKNPAGVALPGVTFAPLPIAGGNIQVPHDTKGK